MASSYQLTPLYVLMRTVEQFTKGNRICSDSLYFENTPTGEQDAPNQT